MCYLQDSCFRNNITQPRKEITEAVRGGQQGFRYQTMAIG